MSIIFKIIYFGSLLFIALCFLVSALFKIFPLEFTSESYQSILDDSLFWGVPFAVLLTITKIGFKKNLDPFKIKMIITKRILISVCYVIFFFCYSMLSFGFNMCGWTTDKDIFKNRSNNSVKIVKRSFGCGATDSSPALVQTYKTTQITPFFIYVRKIDTNVIDKKEWIRILDK